MFKNSPKIFNHYKSDFPENTIRRIVSGFGKLGLDLHYLTNDGSGGESHLHSGKISIKHTQFSANGKGVTPILSEASAWAEIAERFSSALNLNLLLDNSDLSFTFVKKSLFWDLYERHRMMYQSFVYRGYLKGYDCQGDVKTSDSTSLKNLYPFTSEEISLLYQKDVLQHWVDAYSLLENRTVKIPPKIIDILSSSNGLASGNTLEEAFVQAMMEAFERYALYSVFMSQQPCPTIDPQTIHDEGIQHYIALFKSINIKVIIKDFSLGGKVPVVGVIFENKNIENSPNLLKRAYYSRRVNAGAHFNRVEAVRRCFTESLQGYKSLEEFQYHHRLDLLWRFWHDQMGKAIEKPIYPLRLLSINNDCWGDKAFLDQNAPVIPFEALININHQDFIDDIAEIISICKNNGWKVYVINYTHPILGFPTVRVIVPPISYLVVYQRYGFPFQWQFPLKEGLDVFGIHIPRDWCPTRDEVIKLKDAFEWYVSWNLFLHNAYSWNAYSALSAFRVLSVAHLILGNFIQARQYADFMKELNIHENIVNVVESYIERRGLPPPVLIQEGLFNHCECVDCLIRFPQTLHKMVSSFYES